MKEERREGGRESENREGKGLCTLFSYTRHVERTEV